MSLKARIVAYDKAAAEARAASAPPSTTPAPIILQGSAIDDDDSLSPFHDSPDSCGSSTTSSSSHRGSSSNGEPISPTTSTDRQQQQTCRANEHLAVLIPRDLWKPDRLASRCDKYACRLKFSLFERKHHCRKCGGVFCHQCSARTSSLLDTTNLPFLLPPKGVPISIFAGPNAPIHVARICDDCYEQLNGYPTPRRQSSTPPQPVAARSSGLTNSYSSLSSLSIATPPDARPLYIRSHTYDYLPRPVKTTKLEGDLDRYPLKDPSATCKAAGGGRWSPTPIPPRWDARLPDGRLRHEAEAERKAAAQRRRLANPVIVDGPIRVRRPRKPHRDSVPPLP